MRTVHSTVGRVALFRKHYVVLVVHVCNIHTRTRTHKGVYIRELLRAFGIFNKHSRQFKWSSSRVYIRTAPPDCVYIYMCACVKHTQTLNKPPLFLSLCREHK